MAAEAHRLQAHAGFEVEVAIAVSKEQFDRKHMQTDSETEGETPAGGPHDETFPDYDFSTSAEVAAATANEPPRCIGEARTVPANSL